MFIQKDLVIKNYYVCVPQMTGVKEEDLGLFAPRTLDDFYQYNHIVLNETLGIGSEPNPTTRMMAALPYVAEHYNLDKNELLKSWTEEFGLARMMRDSDDN